MEIIYLETKKLNINDNHCKLFLKIINREEYKKINKFKFLKDKKLSLASLMLQYYILNLNNINFNIQKSKYGKPFVTGLNYNVSHDNDICVIVSSKKYLVGIDIMSINRNLNISLKKVFLTDKEILNVKSKLDLISFWCLKEAYLKAIGLGLNYNLKDLEFKICKDNIKLYVKNVLQSNWNFKLQYLKKYIIAVAFK